MKNLIYFMTLMFTIVLASTSCEKDPTTPDNSTGLITAVELNGTWNFQKYSNTGIADITTATTCNQISLNPATSGKRWIKLGLDFKTQYSMTYCDLNDACDTPLDDVIVVSFTDNKITLDNGVVFLVTKYTSATKVLELKMIAPISNSDFILDNGIYSLVKQ